MKRESWEGENAAAKQDFVIKSISRLGELCPQGVILLLGDCESLLEGALKESERGFDCLQLTEFVQPQGSGKPEDYEIYAGVLLLADLQAVPGKELPILLNKAWNSLLFEGGFSLIVSGLDEQEQEKINILIKQAGFYKLEESIGSGLHCVIAIKPRLGTNLLDYGVDKRAAGQTP
jgi:hypothetical protein